VLAEGQLALDEGLGELELRAIVMDDVGSDRAAIDHLHVVDTQDRQTLTLAEVVGPGLEVADHDLCPEAPHQLEVGTDLRGQCRAAREHVGPKGRAAPHAIVLVDDVHAVDAMHPAAGGERLAQELCRAPRGHDLHLVPRGEQMLEHDARTHRMPHALPDDAI
jgi:hypothetical protein